MLSDNNKPPVSIPVRQIEWPPDVPNIDDEADDKTLLKRIKSDDAEQQNSAWAALYKRYRIQLWQQITSKIYHQEDAQDIYLTVWKTAVEKLPTDFVWQGKPIIAWLSGITQNQICKHISAQTRAKKIHVLLQKDFAPIGTSCVDWATGNSYHEILEQAIDRLKNPQHEQIIRLRYMKGLSIKEIAARLDKQPNAVTQAHKRALKKLQSILCAMVTEEGRITQNDCYNES